MANQELLNYLKQFLATGQGTEAAKKILLGTGWSEVDINAAIKELEVASSKAPAVSQGQSGAQFQAGGFSPQAASIQSQVQSGHSKKKIIFSLIVALLVLSGGGAYAYFYVLETETPDEVLSEAFSNLSTARSLSSEASLSLNIPQGPDFFGNSFDESDKNDSIFPISAEMKVKGAFDFTDILKLKGSESVELSVEYGGVKVDLGFDFLVLENKFYLKPTKFPEILAQKIGIETSSILNKWILVDMTSIEEGSMFLGGGMFMTGGLPSDFPFSHEQVEKLTQAFYGIFKIKEELPQEEVGGVKSYHYFLGVDQEAAKKLLIEYGKLMIPSDETFTPEEEEDFAAAINEGFGGFLSYIEKNITSRGLEIWIGKADKFPRKMALEVKVDDGDYGIKIDFSFTANCSGFNEPVTIEAPEDAVSIEDLMASLGAGATSGALAEMRDSTRFSDLSTMNSAIALYLSDVAAAKLCASKKTIYASTPIKPPAGWVLGKNSGMRGVDGSGWFPVNFGEISTGAPIPNLPVDPINDASKKLVYLFACDPASRTYEFNAIVQSEKFLQSMSADKGDDPAVYEIGTDPGLNLIPKGFWGGVLAP